VIIYIASAMGLVMAFETWCLWRVLDRLSVLSRFEDRLSTLTHTMTLLTDTTETCFQAVAAQLEQERPARTAAPAERATRQRRVVVAARRGRSVTDIAAAEEVAEGEVRLRLHLAEQAR
jgi:DNA-directed RNA polymerase specialized sigma24 family protein